MRNDYLYKRKQLGFTLFELMVAIAIMSILTAIGVPMYQNYIQKAALVDVLRILSPHKTALELCILEEENITACNDNIFNKKERHSRYIHSLTIKSGHLTVRGSRALKGLTIQLIPHIDTIENNLTWQTACSTQPKNIILEKSCMSVFYTEPK